MGKLLKRSILCYLCVMGVVGMLLPIAFSQEEADTKAVSGEIISMDTEKSELVVKYVSDETSGESAEMTVNVNTSTLIEEEDDIITLSDLEVGDEVNVEYISDKDGKNTATYIRINDED